VKLRPAALGATERRVVLGACLISGAAQISLATFNFVITPMVTDLEATESQQSLLRQLPSIGALLVIFLAGVLGPRVGARRFLMWCGALMSVGYFIVAIAPVMGFASAGLLLGSMGRQGLFVIVIGMLAAKLTTGETRASGFAYYTAVTPLVFLVFPTIAGALVEVVSWRAVALLWVVSGIGAVIASRRLLPPDDRAAERISGELWTPALAGFVLACLVETLNNGSSAGWTSTKTLVWISLGILTMGALIVLMRHLKPPTLDISMLRHGGLLLLLLVVVLMMFTNLWFYLTVGLQYIYGYTAFQAAVLMMPSQAAGIVGAVVAARLITRRGIRFAGTAALILLALSLFLCMTQTVTTPVWIPLTILCVYSAALTAAIIAMTNSVMNLAPPGVEGTTSAFRGASANLGAALGVVVMTAVVYGTFEASLTTQLTASGQSTAQVGDVSSALRGGTSSEEVASEYSIPFETVDAINDGQKQAMVDAYRAQGLAGGLVVLLAAAGFFLNRRVRSALLTSV